VESRIKEVQSCLGFQKRERSFLDGVWGLLAWHSESLARSRLKILTDRDGRRNSKRGGHSRGLKRYQ